ncbi:hypothetical protein JGC56_07265 [Salmonella enterica subsp. enterica serovar Saintpaul]|nr:hypothetical protein [Salmonella enterica subsp. enterica serovar Saintpaul]
MKSKKITTALILLMGGLYFHNALAISESYRAQLQKSGCTQVSEANGTCNIHPTQRQNAAQASRHHGQAEPEAAADVARTLDRHIAGKYQGEAVDYMEALGWESQNEERTRWRKAGFTARFDMDQSSGQVMGVSVR